MPKKVYTPNTKPRFGDARDTYLKALNTAGTGNTGGNVPRNPCTSNKSLSTMPRRQK